MPCRYPKTPEKRPRTLIVFAVSDDILDAPLLDAAAVIDDDQLVSHWEELAEWPPERLLHACYLTMSDQPDLRALVADYQQQLAPIAGLDLIQPEWLHMTIQGVRFIDEVHPESIIELAWRLDDLFRTVRPFEVVVERPVGSADSILMPVRPIEPLAAIREDMRHLLASLPAFGELFVLPGQQGDFDPHISIAYVNAPTSGRLVSEALAACPHAPLRITVSKVSMIMLGRSDRRYHWLDERAIPFGD